MCDTGRRTRRTRGESYPKNTKKNEIDREGPPSNIKPPSGCFWNGGKGGREDVLRAIWSLTCHDTKIYVSFPMLGSPRILKNKEKGIHVSISNDQHTSQTWMKITKDNKLDRTRGAIKLRIHNGSHTAPDILRGTAFKVPSLSWHPQLTYNFTNILTFQIEQQCRQYSVFCKVTSLWRQWSRSW